jgi:hypothetical protein
VRADVDFDETPGGSANDTGIAQHALCFEQSGSSSFAYNAD